MKMSQKRTCNDCCAWQAYDTCNIHCGLGCKIKTSKKPLGQKNSRFTLVKSVPQEPCPKPKTNMQWCTAIREFKKNQNGMERNVDYGI